MQQLLYAALTMVAGVVGCAIYFFSSNFILDMIFPSKGTDTAKAGRNIRRANMIRPWLFLGPALLLMIVYLVYPVIATFILSFYDRSGGNFVGLSNYWWAATDAQFRQSIFNNILWLAVVPAACTFFGLVIAVLSDRIWWGNIAKSLIFMPMAISFVGASVIWKFIYEYRGADGTQIGLLNAIVQYFGGDPQVWIAMPIWNNFFLMVILIWIQTGFAMVILSAAIKAIPDEQNEAAQLDGASAWQRFWSVTVPGIRTSLVVVLTTVTIAALKVYDIVAVMTGGRSNSSVLGFEMVNQQQRFQSYGHAAALAVLIFVFVAPLIVYNIVQLRKQREIR